MAFALRSRDLQPLESASYLLCHNRGLHLQTLEPNRICLTLHSSVSSGLLERTAATSEIAQSSQHGQVLTGRKSWTALLLMCCMTLDFRTSSPVMMRACSVVSDSSRPHGPQPTRLLYPWSFSGKKTGVGRTPLGDLQTQGSNPGLLHLLRWQADSLPWSRLGSPCLMMAVLSICHGLNGACRGA